MSEFKFNCPGCGQHILANEEWVGRPIECPSCKKRITIPPRTTTAKESAQVAPPTAEPKPKVAAGSSPAAPAETTKATKAPADRPPTVPPPAKPPLKEKPAKPEAGVKPPEPSPGQEPTAPLRIAALTPVIKLDMVRAVRKRIADESAWLPGKIKGANAYAAKMSGGEPVPVEVTSPEAARFSLIGAFLLELQLRRVVRTAAGRTRLLDQEIPEATREVLLNEASDEQGEPTEDALANKDLATITHAQCLATLDALEERYSQRMEQTRVEQAKGRLGKIGLGDLVKKLEGKARIEPEEVATALYHELFALRRRLDRLEDRIARNR